MAAVDAGAEGSKPVNQVNIFSTAMLWPYVPIKPFQAGNIANEMKFWNTITGDKFILNIIKGYDIELTSSDVKQDFPPLPYVFSEEDSLSVQKEIELLQSKGVIEPVECPTDGYVSNIFLRKKKNGTNRVILNLKKLNKHVAYRHFKMDNLQAAINLMTPNCYMASIDWRDAYYSVPIAPSSRKYLTFAHKGLYYQYTCLPNGLASAPRIFTKITKVLFSHLRKLGINCVSYIDDCLLVAENELACKEAVLITVEASVNAGFTVHPEKSVFLPVTTIEFLGFVLDSVTMTVKLTEPRVTKIVNSCNKLLNKRRVTIHEVAETVGLFVAAFQGVEFAPLYYRRLDNEKTRALKLNKDDYARHMPISQKARGDLHWWIKSLPGAVKSILPKDFPSVFLASDASKIAWGAVNCSNKSETGGHWNQSESVLHINCLELLSAYFALKSLARDYTNTHICIYIDNTTAVSYINHMGGRMATLNSLARKIWDWCQERSIWLSAAHLPGTENLEADLLSRSNHTNSEWQLKKPYFESICQIWGKPDIDLFATRLNCQVKNFVSWKPDPYAFATDAFSVSWSSGLNYIFPPFVLIGKVLQKIFFDEAEAIVVVPYWPTQTWFTKIANLLIDCPFLLPRGRILKHQAMDQDTLPKMRLIACRLSGLACKNRIFLDKLRNLYCPHGGRGLKNNMPLTLKPGWRFVAKNVQIHCHLI